LHCSIAKWGTFIEGIVVKNLTQDFAYYEKEADTWRTGRAVWRTGVLESTGSAVITG
jgi:hypothetical protein